MKKLLPILLVLFILVTLAAPLPVAAQGQDTCATATLHYKRSGTDYKGWGLHIWGPTAVNDVTWTSPFMTTGKDEYGVLWEVPMAENAAYLNYLVHNGDEKDPGPDQVMTFSGVGCEIWLAQGSEKQYLNAESALGGVPAPPPAVELSTAPAGGDDQAVIHYKRADANYAGWGLHIWGPTAVEGVTWESPFQPEGQDEYGVYWLIDMQAGAESLNYIIHNGDVKDPGPDQTLEFSVRGREIWQIEGSAEQFTSLESAMSAFQAASLGNIQDSAKAFWLSRNFIVWDAELSADNQYFLNYSPDGELKLTENGIQGGESLPLVYIGTVMRPELASKFPHLVGMSILKLTDEYLDQIPAILRGQVAISAMSSGRLPKGRSSARPRGRSATPTPPRRALPPPHGGCRPHRARRPPASVVP